MKATEVAQKIDAHLKRLEAKQGRRGTNSFYNAGAAAAGSRFVTMTFVSYQDSTKFCLDAAKHYLGDLDRGFEGRAFAALRGTPWDGDPTGLKKTARARAEARWEEKRKSREGRLRMARAQADARGMRVAANLVTKMQLHGVSKTQLSEIADAIRKVAREKVLR